MSFLVEIQALERQTHEVQIAPNRNLGSQITRKTTTMEKVIKKQDRFAVISTQLLHTNLAILHYTGIILNLTTGVIDDRV